MRIQLGILALTSLVLSGCGQSGAVVPSTTPVVRDSIRMTVPFQGELAARHVEMIGLGMRGAAVLTELVPEGTVVKAGDLLARFDSSQIEQDLVGQENEVVRTRQELESLEKAELPLELLDLESTRLEAQAELDAEARFLQSVQKLQERGLMSEWEVAQQEEKVAGLQARQEQIGTRLDLTKKHVHTGRLAKARAALEAAEGQRDYTARQLKLCDVRAPVDGVATLVPLPVGRQYRTAHVGDTLYRNQIFLCLPDPTEHIVKGYILESELPWVQPGHAVEAVPTAFPHLRLSGKVDSVGRMAQTRPDEPVWRKYFPVVITLEPLQESMPVGISVRAEVVAGESADALLLPREALEWRDGEAWVTRASGEAVPVQTGLADLTRIEIIDGLEEGERVRLP
jgi:HlyD family secretion protein